MTEREILIKLIIEAVDGTAEYWAGKIADYLIKNGVIVPPCKVGDTVYFETYNGKGDCVGIQPHKIAYLYNRAVTDDRVSTYLPYEEFGKTVFFIREEAEKAKK